MRIWVIIKDIPGRIFDFIEENMEKLADRAEGNWFLEVIVVILGYTWGAILTLIIIFAIAIVLNILSGIPMLTKIWNP